MKHLLLSTMFFLSVMLTAQPLALSFTSQGGLAEQLVAPQTQQRSVCLGIRYSGVETQAMLGYEASPDAVASATWSTEDGYDVCTIPDPAHGGSVQWYFRDGGWVSPLVARTQGWTCRESRFFRFFIENPALFTDKGAASLDEFVEKTAAFINLTDGDVELLEREKINYYFCASLESVKRLTGYDTRGVLMLADNAVVSSLPCHYHEVGHLLVNFALKEVPPYTHPFLQEGIATCLGGRDGKTANVINGVGEYLLQSGFIGMDDLLDGAAFQSLSPSLTYPAAAACHKRFFDGHSVVDYLDLYRSASSLQPGMRNTRLSGLPGCDRDALPSPRDVLTDASAPKGLDGNGGILPDEDGYWTVYGRPGWLLFSSGQWTPPLASPLFQELLPAEEYRGEEYAVRMGERDVAVYDLFTQTLVAAYYADFSLEGLPLLMQRDVIVFRVADTVFAAPTGAVRWVAAPGR